MGFPYSKIQAAHAFSPGLQLSQSVSFAGNVTKGNLLIFWFGNGVGNSLTDTQGNTWHALSSTNNFGAGSNIAMSYTIASATGPCTVTVANTVTQEVWCIGVVEYGVPNPITDKNSGTALGAGNGKCPTPITTGLVDTLTIAVAIGTTAGGSPDVWTIDSGFTVDDTMTSAPFNAGFCVGSLNVAGAGVLVNPTFTNAHWTFGIDVTEANFQGGAALGGPPMLPPSQTSVARPPVNIRVINLPKICSKRKPRCPLPIQVGKVVFVGSTNRK